MICWWIKNKKQGNNFIFHAEEESWAFVPNQVINPSSRYVFPFPWTDNNLRRTVLSTSLIRVFSSRGCSPCRRALRSVHILWIKVASIEDKKALCWEEFLGAWYDVDYIILYCSKMLSKEPPNYFPYFLLSRWQLKKGWGACLPSSLTHHTRVFFLQHSTAAFYHKFATCGGSLSIWRKSMSRLIEGTKLQVISFWG